MIFCSFKVNRDHVLRSHIPFNASCEHCVRGRGLEPARRVEREDREGAQKEVQVDKFQYKGLWFLVLVLVGCFAIGAAQYREVSGLRGNEARESMLADMSAWGRSVGLVGVDARDLSVCVRSDLEGVVRNLAQSFADGLTAGAVEVTDVPVGRHAPVAERAVRTLKESANTLCVGLENVGLEPYGNGVTYLLKHCAQAHNRYAHLQGSALSPEQKALKSLKAPHPMYVWGAAVLATPPPSLRDKITGRYGQAAYLGPEVASGSHIVQFRLRDGSYKVARSARIRMVVPVTFELSCLRGVCRLLPGRSAEAAREFPRIEGKNERDLPLPDTATRGPPREWVEEHGRTPRCRVCRARGIDVSKAYHSPDCRRRYAEFIKNSFDPSRFLLNERQAGLEDYEGDLGEQAFQPAGEPELPDVPAVEEEFDYSPDYEPGEAVQPGAGAWSDNEVERGVELELREDELVEPSSLVEFPEDEEAMMEVEPEALDRVPREDAEGMMMNIEHREALSFAAVSPKEEIVELGGEKLVVEMPYSSVDDTNGGALDVGLTYEGMLRELRALESLAVGDVIWEVDPKEKVISTRWVSNAKTERVDGRENHLVRCRVVARDFAQGATAAQLGISSATSSAEALRTFICYAGSKKRNIVGLDVSTAFLFADLDPDGRVVVRLPDGVKGRNGRRGFLRLKKALYGLRIAAQQWSRHLAKLLKKLCGLEACETEPCLFSGTVCGGQRVVVLCYVDDLLVTGDSDEAIYYVVEKLKEAVKLKVTSDLDRDGMITFLGRQIYRNPGDEFLYFGMSSAYFEEILKVLVVRTWLVIRLRQICEACMTVRKNSLMLS